MRQLIDYRIEFEIWTWIEELLVYPKQENQNKVQVGMFMSHISLLGSNMEFNARQSQ